MRGAGDRLKPVPAPLRGAQEIRLGPKSAARCHRVDRAQRRPESERKKVFPNKKKSCNIAIRTRHAQTRAYLQLNQILHSRLSGYLLTIY